MEAASTAMRSNDAVLVTGANGFVGRALCETLAASGRRVRRAVRAAASTTADTFAAGDIGADTDWRNALEGISCVVHLAARTHVLRETAADPEYWRVNVDGTRRLAQQAAQFGVRRLVFVSSVKVNGEASEQPFTENDAPRPGDAYGVSKWEAEQALARVAVDTGLEAVVLRPPLVYGPGVKGNFLRLMNFIARGMPLPLASIANRRSLIYAGNLVDVTLRAIDAPGVAGRTYLISDGNDVSTPDLVRALARALGVAPRLLPCPPVMLMIGAALVGRRAELARLAGSLQVDGSAARRELGWRPRFNLSQGLAETARWYYSQSSA
jgi:nucleoside-diphosphate-sugar epimerase